MWRDASAVRFGVWVDGGFVAIKYGPFSLAIRSQTALISSNPPVPPVHGGEQCFSQAPYEFDLLAEHCLGLSLPAADAVPEVHFSPGVVALLNPT